MSLIGTTVNADSAFRCPSGYLRRRFRRNGGRREGPVMGHVGVSRCVLRNEGRPRDRLSAHLAPVLAQSHPALFGSRHRRRQSIRQ